MDEPDGSVAADLVAGTQADSAPAESATGRGSLDRSRILAAAVNLIDQHGLGQLTMRRLGSHLGVEGMALYHYIPGRESLLDGIVETVIDELDDDPELVLVGSDWQGYLRRLANSVRRIALAHPDVFPLIATRPSATPWTRPPLRSLRRTETFLQTLRDCGLPMGDAIAAYRAFSSFLLGHLLIELSLRDPVAGVAGADPAAVPDRTAYPLLGSLDPGLMGPAPVEFDQALELLLQRLAAKAEG